MDVIKTKSRYCYVMVTVLRGLSLIIVSERRLKNFIFQRTTAPRNERRFSDSGVGFGGEIAPGVTPDLTAPPKILTAPPYHHIFIYYISNLINHFSLFP